MKAQPLLNFTATRTTFTTAILSKPLNQKWWYIHGIGEIKSRAGNLSREIIITAYRDKSDWTFSIGFYVGNWLDVKISQTAEADFVKYIEVSQPANAPVEIRNVSVKSNPEFPRLRELTFDVYNKSAKAINGVSYQIVGNGRISVGSPRDIKPQESVQLETTISPSVIFCKGEQKQKLFIDAVWFADDTKWKSIKIKRKD